MARRIFHESKGIPALGQKTRKCPRYHRHSTEHGSFVLPERIPVAKIPGRERVRKLGARLLNAENFC
jgi:hypothetical protein